MLRTPTRALIAVGSTTALTMALLSVGTLPTWADPARTAGDNEHPSSASSELSVLSERETAGESATNDSVRTQGQSAPSASTTGPRGEIFTWNIPATGATLRVEARDATLLTVSDLLTVVGEENPQPTPQPSDTPTPTPSSTEEPSTPTDTPTPSVEPTNEATSAAESGSPSGEATPGEGTSAGGSQSSTEGDGSSEQAGTSSDQGRGGASSAGAASSRSPVLSQTGTTAGVLAGSALAMMTFGGLLLVRRRSQEG